MYNIIGFNFGHDGSAAIIKGGKLVCAISNERLSRVKKAAGVNREMLQYVLDAAGLSLEQIHFTAFCSYYHRPQNYIKVLDERGSEVTRDILHLNGPETVVDYFLQIEGKKIQSVFVHHHMAHAASAYYTCSFDRAACFTLDASQSRPEACSLFACGDGPKLHYLLCPGLMIGNAYSIFTEKLGIGPGLTKSGTTMALASYGRPSSAALQRWSYFGQAFYERADQRSDKVFMDLMWSDLSGLPPYASLNKEQSDSKEAMQIAADIEYIFEQTILKAAKDLYERTKSYNEGNLCLSGGSFLNSVTNMLIKQQTPFKHIHLFPACGDDGTAAGAALYLLHHFLGVPRVRYEPHEFMYLGRSYPITIPGGISYNPRDVAKAISEGQIVAFFSGGSEFGPPR